MNNDGLNFTPFSLNLRGQLREYTQPQVMAVINATPDSFYAVSRNTTAAEIERRAVAVAEQGADFIDLGAYSSRPGADDIDVAEELRRLREAMRIIRNVAPDLPVSIDTFRARVAAEAVDEMGADIINDISGGTLDKEMPATIARLKVPYIMMHMRGTPTTMQSLTDYSPEGVTAGVIRELWDRVRDLTCRGVADIIIDPGFGFAKTVEQNYKLLNSLPMLAQAFRRPILAGLSRKSMIYRPLDITPAESLAGTVTLNTLAIINGAAIVRVHDVAEAVQMRDVLTLAYRYQ